MVIEDYPMTVQPASRVPLVLGNWKMLGSRAQIGALATDLCAHDATQRDGVEVGVCPPFPYLAQIAQAWAGTHFKWGAQHVSCFEQGAYTGEVSADMLADWGCTWVLVGHSERRTLCAEDDASVAMRAQRVLAAHMCPVVCVGESQVEHAAGQTEIVLERQLAALRAVWQQGGAQCIVAYEPVWAIGTGRSATAAQAQGVHEWIRSYLRRELGGVADEVRIIYGGSVKGANAAALLAQPDVDGALVGGASWMAEEFGAIVRAAYSDGCS